MRFLRRNPDRGRVTITLDAPTERELTVKRGAYAGDADAGFIGYRDDLMIRAARAAQGVPKDAVDVSIIVDVIERGGVTNVIPYADVTIPRDARRFRRDLFQTRFDPNSAQLIAVNDGRRRRRADEEGKASAKRQALIYAGNVGEDSDRAAHAVGHVVGHLLFGNVHSADDTTSLMHRDPANAEGVGDEFYTDNFDAFHYDDTTVRRGTRHLDRRWKSD